MLAGAMNPLDLTANQLKRAAALKERIETLNRELRGILVDSANPQAAANKTGTMSAAVKKKIATAQRARWAKLRGAKTATVPAKPAVTIKRRISPATRAKVSAKMKAYWAAKRAGRK